MSKKTQTGMDRSLIAVLLFVKLIIIIVYYCLKCRSKPSTPPPRTVPIVLSTQPVTAVITPAAGYHPAAVGYNPAAVGYNPAAVGYNPAAVGYSPAGASSPVAAGFNTSQASNPQEFAPPPSYNEAMTCALGMHHEAANAAMTNSNRPPIFDASRSAEVTTRPIGFTVERGQDKQHPPERH